VNDRVVVSPPAIREEIARWLPDEMEEHFIDANERMGEALVAIGMALGLPRPAVGCTWGAPEILATINGLHEWACPECGATTRARMADRPRPPAPDPAAVTEFLSWCDTTGEHHGQPWAAMVDTLRETQP
jgi:hypothetical protein